MAHCGTSAAGEYICTLTMTDIATGWTMCRAVPNKGQRAVVDALTTLRDRLPFPVLGIDSDNGSEFINNHLLRYCQSARLTFTRCR
jgi:IS30 family transposase